MTTWAHGGLTYTVTPGVQPGGERKVWTPSKHPRDAHGRFVHVGGKVRLADGSVGKVTAVHGDKVHVTTGGATRVVAADKVSVVKPGAAARDTAHAATPSAPKPAAPSAAPKSGGGGHTPTPLSDAEYERHVAQLSGRLSAARKAGKATDVAHTLGGDGVTYTPERARLHKEIVDDLYARAADAPNDGKAVLAGGLGGAGKSTVLSKHAGIDSSQYVTINPDDVKEEMAKRGMIPHVDGVSPMETADLIHEESGTIANMLAARALADRKNIIFDATMSRRASIEKRIAALHAAGYRDIEGVFVDIPVEASVQRALSRHRRGLEKYRAGQGHGGRYVPPEIIRANSHSTASSANRVVFEELKPHMTRWRIYDNSVVGGTPRLIGSGSGKGNVK